MLPARLTGGAFAVRLQIPEDSRRSAEDVRDALYDAFAMDQLAAHDAYATRYLSDLRRLATLYGGVPDRTLACAFIAGLPDTIRSTMRAATRAEALDLASILARARAVLSDERVSVAVAATRREVGRVGRGGSTERAARQPLRCWACGEVRHVARICPNAREAASAPAPSPSQKRARFRQSDRSPIGVNAVRWWTQAADTLFYVGVCRSWKPRRLQLTTVNSGTLHCTCTSSGRSESPGQASDARSLVVPERPLGIDMVLGMSGGTALGGVRLTAPADVGTTVRSGNGGGSGVVGRPSAAVASAAEPAAAAVPAAEVSVDAADFTDRFSAMSGEWTVAWKWTEGDGPGLLRNGITQYAVT